MAVMIHSKYGYEPPEWVQADARLDRWYKDKKRRAKQLAGRLIPIGFLFWREKFMNNEND